MKKNVKAVSPVIATLMMVLVSVGSAGALYAWQSGWMSDSTEDIGAGARDNLVIAGSSTVYPFTVAAAEMFEAKNPDVKISVTKGGSGAGEFGVTTGKLDIGCASHTVPNLEVDLNNDGTEDVVGQELVTQVATDAVVMVSAHADFENVDLTEEMVEDIYAINGGATVYSNQTALDEDDNDEITWDEFGNFTGETGITGGRIKLSDRAEESGTEEVFTGKVTSLEGYDFCGEQISGLTMDVSAYSNQNLVEEIAADPDVFGFMSLGIALKSDVKVPDTYQGTDGAAVEPTTGNAASGDLQGSRPLNFITLDMDEDGKLDPGIAREFIEFCLIPDINVAEAHAADYVSLYD